MLSLPQFDTYHILKAYADDPDSVRLRNGLTLLKRAAQTNILWQLMGIAPGSADLRKLLELRLGVEETGLDKDADRLFKGDSTLTTEERDSIYMKLCNQAGIHVTQEDLDRMRKK